MPWHPTVGDETLDLLRSNSNLVEVNGDINPAGVRVLEETLRIMEVCGNPDNEINNDTGIIIGYVQSGKTLSFTTLAALSRDNNFQIIIVIAGTSVNLVNQSTDRLRKDLRLDSRFDRKWILLQNPSRPEERETIEISLEQWDDSTFPKEDCRTILITVMKNGAHLRNLASLLSGMDLKDVSVLVIDDEGDQASLNTRSRQAFRDGLDLDELTENEVSTIYRRITNLRTIFPNHTFLQYTATPQANLFINIMDRLSPNFIKLLTPGEDYTGGIQFFRENPHIVTEIPISDVPTPDNILNEIPESLITALKIFFLGVVAGEILKDQRNRSMLIHPSRLQDSQNTYFNWVIAVRESWRRLLSSKDTEEKKVFLESLRGAYSELQQTVGYSLPTFETLTGPNLIHAIQYTQIVEVNTRLGRTPQIRWRDWYSWILVGGQAMDRGFTVEGLTVTYMPRDLGVGNADTVLQRARFFGYKRSYLGFCRVFLPQVTIDAFNSIIEHEQNVRDQLEEFDINNKHLNDWDRQVVLDQMLNLTRANVLYDSLDRDTFGDEWFRIRAPHDTESYIETNYDCILEFLTPKLGLFGVDEGNENRTQEQKHLVAKLDLKDCLEHLLNKLKFTRESDSSAYSSLRGILKRYLVENPDEECLIYLMSARSLDDWTTRIRRLNNNNEIQQLFQGQQPTKNSDQHRIGEIYPGDYNIKDESLVTIQIHLLNLRDTDYAKVPTIAIWIPEDIGQDIIRQPNNRV